MINITIVGNVLKLIIMNRKNIIIAVCGLLLAACSTDEIDTWTGKGYAWFSQDNVDFTFKTRSDVAVGESCLVGIPFETATTMEDYDREVSVEVSRNASDSRTKYELQTPVVFHANHVVDTMWVKVYNSEHLSEVHDTITFKIVANDTFDPGLTDNTQTNLCLYNGYAKPSWWDDSAVSYMGYFTQLKMEVFWAVFGNDDDPRGDSSKWYNNMAVTYALQLLNDYVADNDIRYPDDDPNAPGEQPMFDWGSY